MEPNWKADPESMATRLRALDQDIRREMEGALADSSNTKLSAAHRADARKAYEAKKKFVELINVPSDIRGMQSVAPTGLTEEELAIQAELDKEFGGQ